MPQNDIEGTVLFHTEDGPMAGEAVVRLTYNPENDDMVMTPEAVDNILAAIDDTLYKEVERAKSLCDRFVITVEIDSTKNVLKVGHMEWDVADAFFRAGGMDLPAAWEVVKVKKVDSPNFIVVVRMRGRVLHFDIDTIAFALMRPKPPVEERPAILS
jgi:hypothetical protein